MPIEVVLFDLGGVLIELGGMDDIVAFSGETDEDEIWRRWLHCPWVRRFERGECGPEDFARGMVESWAMPVDPTRFLEAFASWPRGLLPGASDLVRATGRHARVACLSNTNSVHIERQIGEFGLEELFEGLFFSHEIGHVKPDRAAFDHAIERLGCHASEILFLDDNQINVDGARAAGCSAERVVGVDSARALLQVRGLLSPASRAR